MDYSAWLEKAREFYRGGETRSAGFRREQLTRLEQALERRETGLLDALKADLGKPAAEAYASEIGFTLSDIRHARKHLGRWMRPRRVSVPLMFFPARGRVVPEPYGVALILGAWNYPIQLLLSPLVAAMAAGNCAALKPPEGAPATSSALAELIAETFDPAYIRAFEGDAQVAEQLTGLPFDTLFFTGGTETGKKVMRAAAAGLVPVTLELGGRNPCIVCADADLRVASRRIVWGKFINAGQTCVAPNHVYAERSVYEPFVQALVETVKQFYGEDPSASPDYGRIVSDRHIERLRGMLEGITPRCGGEADPAARYLAPTIVENPPPDAPVMREEIFGPILPVVPFDSLDGLLNELATAPKPLALYLFTHDRAMQRRVLDRAPSGGACINDTINHIVGKNLPFGGVGASGMGAYHGKTGFDAFTHYRSVMTRAFRPDAGFIYPPVNIPLKWLKKVFRFVS